MYLMLRAASAYNKHYKPLCQDWSSDKEKAASKTCTWTLPLVYYPESAQVLLIQDDTFKKSFFLH